METVYIIAPKRRDKKMPSVVKASYDKVFYSYQDAEDFMDGHLMPLATYGIFRSEINVIEEV